ncbi:MAG: hypothetical protein R3C28_30760 [Pirellulaceae bacterium]
MDSAKLGFLDGVFGIDCLSYTVMSNHIHLILRSRPDIVQEWSDKEVARRWLGIFPASFVLSVFQQSIVANMRVSLLDRVRWIVQWANKCS